MADPKKSNEMPFAGAVVFTLVGAVILIVVLWQFVLPAAWVQWGYRSTQATVVGTCPTEESMKRGKRYSLAAKLEYTVEGQERRRWVKLPRSTTEKEGPEFDAVQGQASEGQELTCFYDPHNPSTVVLDHNKFEWYMLPGLLCPSFFLFIGVAAMAASWRKAFPRGLRVEAASLLGRLPRRFYLSLAGIVLVVVLGWLTLFVASPGLGCWVLPLLVLIIVGGVVLVRTAARYASVALASPERRSTLTLQADLPPGASAQAPPPAPWKAATPAAVDPGERLPVRLQSNLVGLFSDKLVFVGCGGVFAGIVLGGFLAYLVENWTGRSPPLRVGLIGGFLAVGLAVASVLASRVMRWVRPLTVEVSEHPLRPGGSYRLVVAHPDPAALRRLRLELLCQEETGAGKNTKRHIASRQAIEAEPPAAVAGALPAPPGAVVSARPATLEARLDVPAAAAPSFEMEHHRLTWYVAVGLGAPLLGELRFPVTLAPAAPAELPAACGPKAVVEDGPAVLWIERGAAVFLTGDTAAGGYDVRPLDGRPLRSAELSVLWYTDDQGGREMGVCHYEGRETSDADDLSLYGKRTFAARLPAGPFSYDGEVLKLRWAVRLRLRYLDGEEQVTELRFRLVAASAGPGADAADGAPPGG
jgi:hypothetical protein